MIEIIQKSNLKISRVSDTFTRYLINNIDFKQRSIVIKGARGTGKTTLLLQIGKLFTKQKKVLYVSMDDLFFNNQTLYGFAKEFNDQGGELLLIDEVHKYPNWSREMKLIFDDFSALSVIFTSSSILDIYRGESDLSRRVMSYDLQEMSFREFLLFRKKINLPKLALSDIVSNHTDIALEIVRDFKPFAFFDEYLRYGAYPYYENDAMSYYQKLIQTVQLILEVDLPAVESIDYQNISKIKRLIYVLATNVPFTPNIQKLSAQVELNRNALVRTIQLLEKASLLHTLYEHSKSISAMNKPDKIWLRNTNLMYALSNGMIDKGTLRETFVLQSISPLHLLSLPAKGDLFVDQHYIFEIGGKSKGKKQIEKLENAFVLKDDIEVGHTDIIPLWLFGLLY